MADGKESGRRSPFNFIMAFSLAAIAILSVAGARAQEIPAPGPLNKTKPAEVRIVSTEFRYAPVKVVVTAGRAVTLILDNSGPETEQGLFFCRLLVFACKQRRVK